MRDTHRHSIQASLCSAATYLTECGVPNARDDAEILLAHTLGISRSKLFGEAKEPLSEPDRRKFNRLVARRGHDREPVAYIIESAGFYGLELQVTPAVLIPRPSTETLVAAALKRLSNQARFLDLGTGSGAIALALLTHAPGTTAVATDFDAQALAVASTNASRLGLTSRVSFRKGDLFAPIGSDTFSVIVSNPPYVSSAEYEKLAPELKHEPMKALLAGSEGLDVIRRLVAEAQAHLLSGGRLFVEMGAGQSDVVETLLCDAGFSDIQWHKDLDGTKRVAEAG